VTARLFSFSNSTTGNNTDIIHAHAKPLSLVIRRTEKKRRALVPDYAMAAEYFFSFEKRVPTHSVRCGGGRYILYGVSCTRISLQRHSIIKGETLPGIRIYEQTTMQHYTTTSTIVGSLRHSRVCHCTTALYRVYPPNNRHLTSSKNISCDAVCYTYVYTHRNIGVEITDIKVSTG